MSLAFHLAHPTRTEALMLFDTGPGYKKDEGREGWNRIADSMAAAYEKKGLAAAGASAEVTVAKHRSAQGLAHAARGMLAQKDGARDRVAAENRRADDGSGRRERSAVQAFGRLHGGENTRRGKSDPRRARATLRISISRPRSTSQLRSFLDRVTGYSFWRTPQRIGIYVAALLRLALGRIGDKSADLIDHKIAVRFL